MKIPGCAVVPGLLAKLNVEFSEPWRQVAEKEASVFFAGRMNCCQRTLLMTRVHHTSQKSDSHSGHGAEGNFGLLSVSPSK